jgi:DNA-binding response OmpR family regulator
MSSHLILIVEEDQATRAFLAEQLVADGYEILLAENCRHALHMLADHQPQLVLSDINGQTLGLLDAVRGADGLAGAIDPNTPMIVLTARADELDRVRVFDAAATTWSASRSPTWSCAAGSASCCAEPTSRAPPRSAGSAG